MLHVHWTDRRYFVPTWGDGLPPLAIPATMQKYATEESIPLLPGFERLLLRTPVVDRKGWAFNSVSLQIAVGRKPRHGRFTAEWASKVICDIGQKANVIVSPAAGEKPSKFASAHDLRRSCADQLVAAGVPEREVAAILRHASAETTRRHYAPGNVQRTAEVIRHRLKTPKST
ncbi:site-specific integrase [Lacipirellula limnantheis]|nr:site-specific integrase [Lacipirellula limnantheis]